MVVLSGILANVEDGLANAGKGFAMSHVKKITCISILLGLVVALTCLTAVPTKAFAGTWKSDSVGWWYKNDNGSYPKSTWQKIGGKWYHFNKKGYMQTGWIKTGGKWYYLNSSGKMATGWKEIGGKWYYLAGNGAMQIGWVKSGSKWYYLNKSGVMVTDAWQGSYYLQSDGAMAVDRWVGKYHVDKNGKWDKTKYSENELVSLALSYYKKNGSSTTAKLGAMLDNKRDGTYSIRVYEDYPDHIATMAWYYVDQCGEGTDTFGKRVKLG